MTAPTREDVMIQLDRIDTELESPEADKAAVMQGAQDWLASNPPENAADALYYRERLQAIGQRHGAG
ncbi:MAG: hypothetical protein EOP92_04060 [Lysobacteraceae bacterium]|nr:MAG: hypothetical protein EOP92_04060 [Xanthomonadaceae bacterium]